MRDGNVSPVKTCPWIILVVSLPMRDGNPDAEVLTEDGTPLLAYL